MRAESFVDGRWLLRTLALGLAGAGAVAVYLGIAGRFLPHDERFLGMSARELCALHGCRIVHFMIHDRISFGGALIAIALVYRWLIDDPLRRGERWAWRLLLVSGTFGFASFLAYLAYGYLDLWHGLATLAILPCFALGLARARHLLRPPVPASRFEGVDLFRSYAGVGRLYLLSATFGLIVGGAIVMIVGMTCVFVAQDVGFMGIGADEMNALNPRLVPLIAHDRAGFGGAVCCCGIALFFSVLRGAPSPALWRTLALTGLIGFGTAIGTHPLVGYVDLVHLAPAVVGALVFAAGLALSYRSMHPRSAERIPVSTLVETAAFAMPTLADLGSELTRLSPARRAFNLTLPFAWSAAYFVFAALGWWPAAVFALIALSFVTFGSVSHDLVHRNLGLGRTVNDVLLCVIELLAVRSGHAYRAAHLNHHARFPCPDDVEAIASRRSLLGALVEGVVSQPRILVWALKNARRDRGWILGESIACVCLAGLAIATLHWTPIFFVYLVLMTAGAWTIPLVTSYVPHDPTAKTPLLQTRRFRGKVASVLALEHLYHLEHHLYPAVPHQNWPRLARRLDPYFDRAGVPAIRFWF
jgi:beta-carotene hydroxylase